MLHPGDMTDVHSETPSGSRHRSRSHTSDRSGAESRHSSRGSNRSHRSSVSAHVVSDPSAPTKMEAENVATKRSEPAAPTIDLSFDSPDNKKDDKLPRKQVDPVKPYPPEPTFGSAVHQSSASASSTGLTPVPDLPAFRGQSGVMHVQPPYEHPSLACNLFRPLTDP